MQGFIITLLDLLQCLHSLWWLLRKNNPEAGRDLLCTKTIHEPNYLEIQVFRLRHPWSIREAVVADGIVPAISGATGTQVKENDSGEVCRLDLDIVLVETTIDLSARK